MAVPVRNVIFLVALLLHSGDRLYAQKLRFDQLTVQQGLPSNEVYNLFQDKKGYLWAFTANGMVKHNGAKFIPACKNISWEKSIIYAVQESLQGEMYVANSQAEIYRVENDSAFQVPHLQEMSKELRKEHQVIYNIVVADPSTIYFSTFEKSYLLSGGHVEDLTEEYHYDSIRCDFRKVGRNFAVLKKRTRATSNQSSFIFDTNNQVLHEMKKIANHRWRRRINMYERKGHYYILGDAELILTSGKETKRITFSGATISLEISPENHVWVCTSKGLYEFTEELEMCNSYFAECFVSDILFDQHKGIWVSTIEKGVFYCRNSNYNFLDVKELKSKVSILKKIDNDLFIGTSSGHLFVKRGKDLIQVDIGHSIHSITDIITFGSEYLIGTKGGIIVLDNRLRRKGIMRQFVNQHKINSYGFAKNDSLLVSISGTAMWEKPIRAKGMVRSVDLGAKTKRIVYCRNTGFLAGTSDGFFIWNDSVYVPAYLEPLHNNEVSSMTVDNRDNVWIGTKGSGLYILHADHQLSKVGNCPSDFINQINFVHDTVLLLSTNKGLFINNTIHLDAPWTQLEDNEIFSAEFFNGEICFATSNGLFTFDQQHLSDASDPQFYLSSIVAAGKIISAKDIRLAHNENEIFFNFDILAYENMEHSFSYRLEGPDPGQGDISGTQLHLQNLSPGQYTLYANAIDNAGKMRKNGIVIPFSIQPAIWQRTSFYMLIVVIAFSVIWYLFYRFREREKAKAHALRQLAEHRLTALKAQINPHFISNSLSAIQQLVSNNEIDKANQYIAKFSLLLRYSLQYSDKYRTQFINELEIIDIIVDLEKLRFDDQFVFEKDLCAGVDLEEIYVPPLITQPIIENAIWHGLLPLQGKRIPKLTLKTEVKENNFCISIIDNGIGRLMPEDSQKERQVKRESKGFALIKGWIENLNMMYPSNYAEINIIDLKDENNQACGTRVDILFSLDILNELSDQI